MVAPHEREVIIRLILEPDKGKATQALAEIRKITDGATTQAKAAAKATTDVTTKAADEQVKAIKKVAAEQEKFARVARQNQMAFAGALKQSAAGAMLLGRSLAMLGTLGEKDLEKVLRALVKIQMAYDSMRGAWQLIEGMTRAWKAYQAAVQGAAAAQAALAATQMASGAAGTAARGAAGGVAGSAAGRLAGVGVAGAAGGVAVAKAGGLAAGAMAVAPPVAIGAAITAALAAVAATVSKDFRNLLLGAWESIGKDERLKTALQKSLSRQFTEQGEKARAAVSVFQARVQGGGLVGQAAIDEASAAQRKARGGTAPAMIAASQMQITALQEMVRVEEARKSMVAERTQRSLTAAKDELRILHEQYQVELRKANLIRDQRKGAAERFGQESPMMRMRLIRAKQKLEAGQTLTHGEEQSLARYREIGSVGKPLGERFRERAWRGGFGAFGGREMEGEEAEARRRAQGFQRQTPQDLDRSIRDLFKEIDTSFEPHAKAIAGAFDERIQKLKQSMMEWTVRAIKDGVRYDKLQRKSQEIAAMPSP